jgi:hypothetical protein
MFNFMFILRDGFMLLIIIDEFYVILTVHLSYKLHLFNQRIHLLFSQFYPPYICDYIGIPLMMTKIWSKHM